MIPTEDQDEEDEDDEEDEEDEENKSYWVLKCFQVTK